MINALESSSTRPYLIRALYEWCTDNGFTPYVAVQVDDSVQVPREYVKNGEIVLNISFDATSSLKLGNDFIEFKARFAGTAREISVPVSRVLAIYARENGQGMAFPTPAVSSEGSDAASPTAAPGGNATGAASSGPARLPLRDASRGTEGDAGKVVHLMTGEDVAESAEPGEASPSAAADEPDDEPPRPPVGGSGARPSLKRIK